MHLFSDYVQPLTLWLYDNPNWALLITFTMSFAESLAIIGSIVPGSVTMTAIGILAGSGVMDIGLTFLAAVVGAVAGDGASYALGYAYSDRLTDIWPFRRYPLWIEYGKIYFAKHGGKSVLIGRFFGPLRSIIPVIAGMLRMNHWHFLLANVISAMGWAVLYVVPGVLIGAASAELSAESATRLFMFILALLAIIWAVSLGVKWLLIHLNHLLHLHLHRIWTWSTNQPRFARILKICTPCYERNHFPTLGLIFLFILFLCLSIAITVLVIQGSYVTSINNPSHLFLQSLRTRSFDSFFIVISLAISSLSLLIFTSSIACGAIYYRDWRMLKYWISIVISCSLLTWVLSYSIEIPKPVGLLHYKNTLTFPAINLTLATALFGFLIGYVNTYYRSGTIITLRIALTCLLFLAGLAIVYLGDNWASSVIAAYCIGMTICIAHWIGFRRTKTGRNAPIRSALPILLSCLLLLITMGISSAFYFKKLIREHAPYLKQYVLTHEAWWNQSKPLLPVYTVNRIGNRMGLFNIQYHGSLSKLEQVLIAKRWKPQRDSLFYSLLMRASGQNSAQEVPLMAQLYLNRKPTLIMRYANNEGQTQYILRLWRSNYHLRNYHEPIWLGSIVYLQSKSEVQGKHPNLFSQILPALDGFEQNIIPLPANHSIKASGNAAQPEILMIKELRNK